MEAGEFTLFREYVVHGILNTDMMLHKQMMTEISLKLDQDKFLPHERRFGVTLEEDPPSFLALFGLLVHTADLYSSSKPREVSLKWVELINQEFTNQYHEEKSKGYRVSTFFADLNVPLVKAKGETFFIKTFILPLWQLTDRILENSLEQELRYIKDNLSYWEEVAKQESAKAAASEKK